MSLTLYDLPSDVFTIIIQYLDDLWIKVILISRYYPEVAEKIFMGKHWEQFNNREFGIDTIDNPDLENLLIIVGQDNVNEMRLFVKHMRFRQLKKDHETNPEYEYENIYMKSFMKYLVFKIEYCHNKKKYSILSKYIYFKTSFIKKICILRKYNLLKFCLKNIASRDYGDYQKKIFSIIRTIKMYYEEMKKRYVDEIDILIVKNIIKKLLYIIKNDYWFKTYKLYNVKLRSMGKFNDSVNKILGPDVLKLVK